MVNRLNFSTLARFSKKYPALQTMSECWASPSINLIKKERQGPGDVLLSH